MEFEGEKLLKNLKEKKVRTTKRKRKSDPGNLIFLSSVCSMLYLVVSLM